MTRSIAFIARKKSRVGGKERKSVLLPGPPQEKKQKQIAPNRNYRAAEAKKLTPFMNQRLPIVDRRRTQS